MKFLYYLKEKIAKELEISGAEFRMTNFITLKSTIPAVN